ncbi:MAG TPA: glutathione S-transferase family protein [Candidatus Binatia bacterium]|nr:glutathione S-transferase family protein [Candidatus Binatia bacterium]
MKLYHRPQSRSVRPRWLLEEIGAPYQLISLDHAKGEDKTPAYLKIHPHGAVPALVDGDVVLFESAAICAYLADKFPDKHLAPPIGTPARGLYYQWMFYAMATLEPPVLQIFMNTIMLPEAERSAAAAEQGRKAFVDVARVLSQALMGKPYLLGEQFSAADVMIGSTLGWGQFMGLLEGQPELSAYVQRLSARPAFQRAQAG